VQYPGIADTIEDDFKNVMQMLALTRWISSGRQLQELTQELKQHLLMEVDYQYELTIAQRMAARVADDSRYYVPTYYTPFCTGSVLAMEFVEGLEVNHPDVQALSQARRNRLAEAMLTLFFNEAFEWRLMQTDPNFGNYRILIDDQGQNDRLVLLDFGAVRELPIDFSRSLKKTILAAHYGDVDATIEGATELRCLKPGDSERVKRSFADFCCYILEPFASDMAVVPEPAVTADGLYDWRASRLLNRAGRVGSEGMMVKGFAVPPSEFMLMMRKLTGVFTFVAALGAKMNAAELLEQHDD
jgi:predicted unusual protein kinase regulating ubiquinone biosynthesis (AarF/ABC1/UbiB family)